MAEIIFIYKRQSITIECDINKKMKDICKTFSEKINMDLNSLLFSYGANTLNLEDTFNKITKKNKIIILVKDISDKKDIRNEIICIYNKKYQYINLLHDYTIDMRFFEREKMSYEKAKKEINENNIEIYVNDKKIKFNYIYKSNEKGEIKVRFKFKKFLNSTNYMFFNISSLISIDLSSFISTDVNNMSSMFWGCYSLESINLSSLNTAKVENMDGMFMDCYSLKLIDLSSFNTVNVENMRYMFSGCSSLKSIDLSSFNTVNVENMRYMFSGCSSLTSINLSSFNTTNVF